MKTNFPILWLSICMAKMETKHELPIHVYSAERYFPKLTDTWNRLTSFGSRLTGKKPELLSEQIDIVRKVINKPCVESLVYSRYPDYIILAAIREVLCEIDWDETRVTGLMLAKAVIELQDEYSDGETKPEYRDIHGELGAEQARLLRENNRLKTQLTCRVCKVNNTSIIFLPCGHLVTCVQCAPSLTECVVCHRQISEQITAYT